MYHFVELKLRKCLADTAVISIYAPGQRIRAAEYVIVGMAKSLFSAKLVKDAGSRQLRVQESSPFPSPYFPLVSSDLVDKLKWPITVEERSKAV